MLSVISKRRLQKRKHEDCESQNDYSSDSEDSKEETQKDGPQYQESRGGEDVQAYETKWSRGRKKDDLAKSENSDHTKATKEDNSRSPGTESNICSGEEQISSGEDTKKKKDKEPEEAVSKVAEKAEGSSTNVGEDEVPTKSKNKRLSLKKRYRGRYGSPGTRTQKRDDESQKVEIEKQPSDTSKLHQTLMLTMSKGDADKGGKKSKKKEKSKDYHIEAEKGKRGRSRSMWKPISARK
ncbi:hypothetical protein LOTGIDRAFT_153453 [Lottia gigantea]|uniref:Uncharacterized protein n=1 Tax=Lottia gigantea TaxID=225164 RepID=V4AFR8_LOTGI|nr:hypothetical protein LOTGIDRAFT_153453 [Lottia gigantea]ESO93975.1 hypothetical protein LOTGIDRAFT_153453 [Lottia gigantea]